MAGMSRVYVQCHGEIFRGSSNRCLVVYLAALIPKIWQRWWLREDLGHSLSLSLREDGEVSAFYFSLQVPQERGRNKCQKLGTLPQTGMI